MATHRACTLPAAEDINDPELRAAYWDALALIDSGWQLRRLRYIPATNAGVIVAHTPTGRPVTITSTDADHTNGSQLPNIHIAVRRARAAATLGSTGDRLGELAWLITAAGATPRPMRPRRDHIPDPALTRQPANLRAAFWLLTTLVSDYHWRISDLGEPAAGGGFTADIPGDVTAIYPATMPADGTAAADLARLIPSLDPASLRYLRHTNPTDITPS